jgi:hypothetical protein
MCECKSKMKKKIDNKTIKKLNVLLSNDLHIKETKKKSNKKIFKK